MGEERKLYRNPDGAMIGGVCTGIADYFNADVTLIRLLWALGTIFSAGLGGIIAYIAFMIIVPQKY